MARRASAPQPFSLPRLPEELLSRLTDPTPADRQKLRRTNLALLCQRVGIGLTPELEEAFVPRPIEKIIMGGIQAGKSTCLALEVLADIINPFQIKDRPRRYWAIMPAYTSEVKEMEYLRAWAPKVSLRVTENWPANSSKKLEFQPAGVTVETKTAQDIAGIASEACDGIIVCEPGQMPEGVRYACIERTSTRKGWITYGGTVEDDEGKPQYAWYADLWQRWAGEGANDRHAAVSLPTWANIKEYPGGRQNERLLYAEEEMGAARFNRRYGGIPDGVDNGVYEELLQGDWCWRGDPERTVWLTGRGAIGHDYGDSPGHPSTLVPLTLAQNDVAVVRDAWGQQTGAWSVIETRMRLMAQRYRIPMNRVVFDPTQREAAKRELGDTFRAGMPGREARVALVKGRLFTDKLAFDMEPHDSSPEERERAERVRQVFRQMQRIHRRKVFKAGQGEVYEYVRNDDDFAAAVETAVWLMDGKPGWNLGGRKSWGSQKLLLPNAVLSR